MEAVVVGVALVLVMMRICGGWCRMHQAPKILITSTSTAWCMIHGVWCTICGFWCTIHVVWCTICGVWFNYHIVVVSGAEVGGGLGPGAQPQLTDQALRASSPRPGGRWGNCCAFNSF